MSVFIKWLVFFFQHVTEFISRSTAWLDLDIVIALDGNKKPREIPFLSRKQCTEFGSTVQERSRWRQWMAQVTAGFSHRDQWLDVFFSRKRAPQPYQLLPGLTKWISEIGNLYLPWKFSILTSLSNFILLHVDIQFS